MIIKLKNFTKNNTFTKKDDAIKIIKKIISNSIIANKDFEISLDCDQVEKIDIMFFRKFMDLMRKHLEGNYKLMIDKYNDSIKQNFLLSLK